MMHPRGVAEVHPQLAAEDDVALAQEPHRSASLVAAVGRGAAEAALPTDVGAVVRRSGCPASASRSERPVRARNTSSSVGRCTSIESRSMPDAVEVADQPLDGPAGARDPAAHVPVLDLDTAPPR